MHFAANKVLRLHEILKMLALLVEITILLPLRIKKWRKRWNTNKFLKSLEVLTIEQSL